MRSLFTCFGCFLLWGNIHAQVPARTALTVKLPSNIFFNEFTGKPFFPGDQPDINGSPFLNADWKLCVIRLKDGRYFEDVPVKLNLFNQTIHYRSPGGPEMEVAPGLITNVQMIDTVENGKTTTRHFANGFKAIGNNNENTYYEILVAGKASLLLCTKVRVVETRAVGLATQKDYQSFEEYYASIDSNIAKCRKSGSFFIELLADKKDDIKKYIEDNNLKFRSEKDYRRIITYYNSLWRLEAIPGSDLSGVYRLHH